MITASVESIKADGTIRIAYSPESATVPTNWKNLFIEDERVELQLYEKVQYLNQALEALQVVYEKNSEEKDQAYFGYNLTDFSPAGVTIKLNFSDPLLVSQGYDNDLVKIRLLKSYFMEPDYGQSADEFRQSRLM